MTRIINTIGWNTPWLRRVLKFCCRELDYDLNKVTVANFSLAHDAAYRGWARYHPHKIRAKINPIIKYPLKEEPEHGLPSLELADPVEVLVRLTAHELAHLERYDRFVKKLKMAGRRDSSKERDTDHLARLVLQSFRQDRELLLTCWGEAGEGPVPPAIIHRLTCPRCHQIWESSRPPRKAHRRSCGSCFGSWQDAANTREFLIYERHDPRPREAGPSPKPLDRNGNDAISLQFNRGVESSTTQLDMARTDD